MSRGLHADMETAVQESVVKPFLLINLAFSSPVNVWSGYGDLNYSSVDYIGVGDLLSFDSVEESQDLGANGLSINLSGINGTTLLTNALTEEYQGKSVTIRLGLFDSSGDIHNTPIIIFEGFMDVLSINEGAENSTIKLSVENKLIQLGRSKIRRYNSNDQRAEHPTDQGFDYVASIAEKDIIWGGETTKPASSMYEPKNK
nr:Phage minor tail protein L [uncultured Mediterranean phage uvMED]